MKFPSLLLVLLLGLSACATSKLSSKGDAEKAFVEAYIQSTKSWDSELKLETYFSPKEIELKNLEGLKVNRYSPQDFKFVSYNRKNASIVYQIWGEADGKITWKHELTFGLEKSNKQLFFKAGEIKSEVKYVDPWIFAKTYLNE